MLSLGNAYELEMMSQYVDEALLTSRYKAQFHTRDGTVLPPTMTSRRHRQATMSVVDMSLAMEDAITPRHQRCYDDRRRCHDDRRCYDEHVSAWRRVKRSRHRRRHDNGGDDVEPMDTGDHPTSHGHAYHVAGDVTRTT